MTEQLDKLLSGLTGLPDETEWIEFKVDNDDPEMIGKNISALSNSATLHKQDRAFIAWGVQHKTHAIVGTDFKPSRKKVGNEDLQNWLSTQLEPREYTDDERDASQALRILRLE